jgi:hypothetical protein
MSFAFLNAQKIPGTFRYNPATLHVYSVNTKKERSYVLGGALSILTVPPQWFHNGKSIVVWVEDAKRNHSPYRVDLDTGAFKRIAEIASSDDISPVGIFTASRY